MGQEADERAKRALEADGYSQDKDGNFVKREENGTYRYAETDGRHTRKDGEQSWTTNY